MPTLMLAALMAQAQAPAILPRFPGCPPEAVSSLCAPPPPPPPHRWDDHALEQVWLDAFGEFSTLSREVTPLRLRASGDDAAAAGEPIGSPAWEAQRQRLIAILAIERRIGAIRQRMIPYANDHRASASAGDMAELDRLTALIDGRRRALALGYERLLAALIDRPAKGEPAPPERDRPQAP